MGTELAGRYRLEERLRTTASSDFWRAVDTTLDRTVGVRLVAPATAEDAMDAARRAAMVDEPALLRVLDVAQEDGDTGPVTYVVTEFVEADSLADLLRRDGPLPADRVRALVGETAQVLSRVAASGLHHEALEPTSVLRTPGGELKIEGLGVDAAAEGRAGAPGEQAARTDAVALVALVYAGLTGHWPLDGEVERPRAGAPDRWHAGAARRRRQRRAERPRHPLRGDLRPRRRRSADARRGGREPAAVDRGRGGGGDGRRPRRRAGHRGAARGRRPAPRPRRATDLTTSSAGQDAERAAGGMRPAGRFPSRGPGAGAAAAAGAAGAAAVGAARRVPLRPAAGRERPSRRPATPSTPPRSPRPTCSATTSRRAPRDSQPDRTGDVAAVPPAHDQAEPTTRSGTTRSGDDGWDDGAWDDEAHWSDGDDGADDGYDDEATRTRTGSAGTRRSGPDRTAVR